MKDFCKSYLNILKEHYSTLNLTRIEDYDEFKVKQYEDSLLPFEQIKSDLNIRLIMDIGFGGGFPLLPLAFHNKNYEFIGIDARRKKVDAVNDIANKLNLKNVICHHKRSEDVIINESCLITMKAVGPLRRMLPLINIDLGSSDQEVYFLVYQGPRLDDLSELEVENEAIKKCHWQIVKKHSFTLSDGVSKRYAILLKYIVPRGTIKKNKTNSKLNLVKLTQLKNNNCQS